MQQIDQLADLARPNCGVITRQEARAAGISDSRLSALVRRGAIARIAHGVYAVGAPVPDALRLSTAWQATISYESAAAWLGVELPTPVEQLHLTVPRARGRFAEPVPGVRLHRADVAPWDIVTVRGARVTSPLRTAMDICRHARVDTAVAIVDSMLRSHAFTVEEYLGAARRAQGPGRLRIQVVASLADPMSGSILESLTRVLLWRNGLPVPNTQLSVRGLTEWIGYVDFAWPRHSVILECDGYEFHSGREPFQKDRRRWSALTAAGWEVGVVTWFDVVHDPSYVVRLVRDLFESATIQHTNVARVAS